MTGKPRKPPLCFTCELLPAGNSFGGPYSAYCAGCQPRGCRLDRKHYHCDGCRRTFSMCEKLVAHQGGWRKGADYVLHAPVCPSQERPCP